MKRNTITILIVLLSVSILFATLLTLPRIDKAQPDPYFHIKITPIIYWIGLSLSIFVTLGIVFRKKEGNIPHCLGLFSVMLLSVYVYDIPKLFYINPIYTDTYIFVGELFYTLRSGHIGWGHSYETPGLALLSSQFSLITGINYIVIAEILQFVLPVLMVVLVYIISKLFASERVGLLACLVFVSIDWIGFYFNRQSLALVLQMFVYFALFKAMWFRPVKYKVWFAVAILSYIALVVSHPLSSLLVVLTLLSLTVLIGLYSLVRRVRHTTSNDGSLLRRHLALKASQLFLVFLVIWFSWNIYNYKSFESLINAVRLTIQELMSGPNPVGPAGSFVSGYTANYLPIVYLRLLEFVFVAIIGLALVFILVGKTKSRWKGLILLSWFIGSILIAPAGLYTGHFFDRSFLHVFPVFSIVFAWFIIPKTPTSQIPKSNRKAWVKAIKVYLLSTMIIFVFMLPITMYCNTPFFYPPTSHLKEMNHVTKHGYGYIAVYEADSTLGYFKLLNNASNIITDFQYNYTTITEYGTVVTTFRAYTKGAFIVEQPSATESIMDIENGLTKNPTFARVYDADPWNRIYFKQSGNKTSLKPES